MEKKNKKKQTEPMTAAQREKALKAVLKSLNGELLTAEENKLMKLYNKLYV